MSNIDHGGPAYPVPEYADEQGMTLRQAYAKDVAASLLSVHAEALERAEDAWWRERLASASFAMADAMIAHERRERREAEAKEQGQ